MHYFAYGSNMSHARLLARVPSAKRLGTYQLLAHELRFHKEGWDQSAKCDALFTGNPQHCIYGALYRIDPDEKTSLDKAEGTGKGYEEKTVEIRDEEGCPQEAFTYIATHVDTSLKPFSWYLQHVLIGAREIQVPEWYLQQLEMTPTQRDPDPQREASQLAIYKP